MKKKKKKIRTASLKQNLLVLIKKRVYFRFLGQEMKYCAIKRLLTFGKLNCENWRKL